MKQYRIPDMLVLRSDHSSCSVNGKAYVYGGYDGSAMNSIECMPFKTNGEPERTKWAVIRVKNFMPRYQALMVPINENILTAGGRYGSEPLSDANILSMKNKKSVCSFDTGIEFRC